MITSLLVTSALSHCDPVSMINFIWFTDKNCSLCIPVSSKQLGRYEDRWLSIRKWQILGGRGQLLLPPINLMHLKRRMPDETDAKQILIASPAGNCRRPLGRPRITWMKTIQQDLKSSDLNMDDAVDLAQKRPLWRLMSTFGATHS